MVISCKFIHTVHIHVNACAWDFKKKTNKTGVYTIVLRSASFNKLYEHFSRSKKINVHVVFFFCGRVT